MPDLLVTGGAGFIGANFVHYWLAQHPEDSVIVLDALTYAGNKANLQGLSVNPRLTFVQGNICDTPLVEQLLQDFNLRHVLHFAAESHVDRSISNPDAFIETNIVGTYSLLKACKKIWLDAPLQAGLNTVPHRFHLVSTDEVYGSLESSDAAFSESSLYAPNSPYSASKAAADHLVRAYHKTYGLQVTTSHCANNYGAYQYPEKLIPLVITNILRERILPVYGDGLQVRDWLYVDDHARALDSILQHGRSGECYNIGGKNEWTNIAIVQLICRLLDAEFARDNALANLYPAALSARAGRSADLIRFVQDRPGHDRRYAINPAKALHELGYRPAEDFASGLAKTLQWYLHNPAWWLPLLAVD